MLIGILFYFILFLNKIYNLNLTVKIVTPTERKVVTHPSGSISINNPITSDMFR
jgi:hypothetical protein